MRDDVDRLLFEGIAALKLSMAADDEITAELWRGQILANLDRFEDLGRKWRLDPLVASMETTAV